MESKRPESGQLEVRQRVVLQVDDEERVHQALETTLRREPYHLLHAYDAGEALAVLEQHPEVCAVVCDHSMPGIRGLDLLARLRAQRPELVTVLLTGNASLELAQRAVNESHVDGFMVKPWRPARLRALLATLLRGEDALAVGRQAAETERRLRADMEPARDPDTGAWIVDAG